MGSGFYSKALTSELPIGRVNEVKIFPKSAFQWHVYMEGINGEP
jgi:hypothetical protein